MRLEASFCVYLFFSCDVRRYAQVSKQFDWVEHLQREIFRSSWPGVSIIRPDETASWICNFYLSVVAHQIVEADPSTRYALYGAETLNKQQTTTTSSFSAARSGAACGPRLCGSWQTRNARVLIIMTHGGILPQCSWLWTVPGVKIFCSAVFWHVDSFAECALSLISLPKWNSSGLSASFTKSAEDLQAFNWAGQICSGLGRSICLHSYRWQPCIITIGNENIQSLAAVLVITCWAAPGCVVYSSVYHDQYCYTSQCSMLLQNASCCRSNWLFPNATLAG